METQKKIILSGIQPSGRLTIGNYLGALRNWDKLQDEYDCLYCVADMHAITVRQDPAELRRRTLETLAIYIACGLDTTKNTLFVQSHVHQHAELSWVLGCYTMFGELSRMTQFKDKSAKNAQNINAGLFTYPVLMAADILLYQADLVPVGIDQKQHIELARDVAERFNTVYSPTFKLPEPYIPSDGAKINSLAEPTKKMSKSDANPNAVVFLNDSRDDIIRKFKRAVTDSESEIVYDENRPGIANLMKIYSCFTGKEFDEIQREFEGKGYAEFKAAVGEACADGLKPIQDKFNLLLQNKDELEKNMVSAAARASYLAEKTLSKVYRKIGFYQTGKK